MTLVEFRKKQKLTQAEMAEIINISFSHYSKIETGARNPSFNFLVQLKLKFPEADINDIFFSHNHT